MLGEGEVATNGIPEGHASSIVRYPRLLDWLGWKVTRRRMSFRMVFVAIVAMALILMARRGWVIRGLGFLVLSIALCLADALVEALRTQRWSAWAIFWILPISAAMASRNVWIVATDLAALAIIVNSA